MALAPGASTNGARCSILDRFANSNWLAVQRPELADWRPPGTQAMDRIRSQPLAHLVSLGGWLRGTEALTALLRQRYSEENAQLLRQPALLRSFEEQLANMSGSLQGDRAVARMAKGLRQMRRALPAGYGKVSRKKSGGDLRVFGRLGEDP